LRPWFETTSFPNGIFRIRERGLGPLHACNVWLVVGSQASLLIDAGVGVAPLAPLVSSLARGRVICLLTHSHYDHIGGAYEFATRHIHAAEADVLKNPTPDATLWRGWLTREAFTAWPSPDFHLEAYAVRPAPHTGLVADGDRIELGDRNLEILHAPGHSPGLVVIFEHATKTLFSSDALYDGRMFFKLPGSNRLDAKLSLARLAALPTELVHPGHYESFGARRLRELADEVLVE
jgi:glyoxylase-like metal-dependent hydrolase (beta-lactamase superfamily II)